MRILFCLWALLSSASLWALSTSEYCDNRCCDVGGWVEAEYLYFRPSVDDTYFVIKTASLLTSPNGTRENNDFGFDSGFRVGAGIDFCDCNGFEIYYARVRNTENTTITGNLAALLGTITGDLIAFTGSASSYVDSLYQRLDALFTHQAWCNCNSFFNLKAGLEYARLHFNQQVEYIALDDGEITARSIINQTSKAWGIGPQFGVDFDWGLWDLCACALPGRLSLAAATSGSLLVSRSQIDLFNSVSTLLVPTDLHDRDTWRIIPAFHARVGLNYATCFSCFDASLEVGYEFTTYIRGLGKMLTDAFVTGYYNFDIQGLYVAATVGF